MKKTKVFGEMLVLCIVISLSIQPATGNDIDLSVYVKNEVFQQQAGGGGENSNGNDVVKFQYRMAPHQSANAIPTDPPREIFIPDQFRKNWHEITRLKYNRLFHFQSSQEVLDMAGKLGINIQNDFFYEKIPLNTDDVVTLDSFPQNGDYLWSVCLETPVNGFNMPTITFGTSIIKSRTNAKQQVIVASLYVEGQNVGNVIATRAGLSILNSSPLSWGFGVGSNTSAGKSRAFTGWVIEFFAFSGEPVQVPEIRKTGQKEQSRSGFYPLIGNENGLDSRSIPKLEENISWLKDNKEILYSGAIIGFDVYLIPGAGTEPAETATLEVIRHVGSELGPELGATSAERASRFRYGFQTGSSDKADTLRQLGAKYAINMRLIR